MKKSDWFPVTLLAVFVVAIFIVGCPKKPAQEPPAASDSISITTPDTVNVKADSLYIN